MINLTLIIVALLFFSFSCGFGNKRTNRHDVTNIKSVPSLNEEDWIKFGNGAINSFSPGVSIVGGTLQLASNYASLSIEYKMARCGPDGWKTCVPASAATNFACGGV
jgi:hypothetical protein